DDTRVQNVSGRAERAGKSISSVSRSRSSPTLVRRREDMKIKTLSTIIAAMAITTLAQAQVIEKKVLTLDGAKKVIDAVKMEARKVNAPGAAIAVVDDGGNLLALERLDGTFAAGSQISIGKARTAALFKRETKALEEIIKNGRTAMVSLPDSLFTPLQGGVPIVVDGQIVRAVA